jgi:hypothetical protein
VVAAGAAGACTLPVDLLLAHAPASTTSNANAPTVVVFITNSLVLEVDKDLSDPVIRMRW